GLSASRTSMPGARVGRAPTTSGIAVSARALGVRDSKEAGLVVAALAGAGFAGGGFPGGFLARAPIAAPLLCKGTIMGIFVPTFIFSVQHAALFSNNQGCAHGRVHDTAKSDGVEHNPLQKLSLQGDMKGYRAASEAISPFSGAAAGHKAAPGKFELKR